MDEKIKNILLREGNKFRPSLENRVAYQYEREISILTMWMDRDRNKNIFRGTAREIIELQNAGTVNIRILDVGCAYGNHIFMLNAQTEKNQNLHFVGVDLNPKSIQFPCSFRDVVPGFGNCDFLLCSVEEGLCFKDASFHIALCSDALEHCMNPAAAMKEISRALKPGGKLILTSPLKSSLYKAVSGALSRLTFGLLERKYMEGSTKESPDVKKEDKPEFGYGHVSELSLSGYLSAGREAGLHAAEIIPTSVFSGSMFFDRHPFLLACLIFIEALHRVFRFVSWAHGVQIVFEKKNDKK